MAFIINEYALMYPEFAEVVEEETPTVVSVVGVIVVVTVPLILDDGVPIVVVVVGTPDTSEGLVMTTESPLEVPGVVMLDAVHVEVVLLVTVHAV